MNGTAYILGAGFSHYAGLPLQSEIHEGNCLQLAITVQDRAARASKTHPFTARQFTFACVPDPTR